MKRSPERLKPSQVLSCYCPHRRNAVTHVEPSQVCRRFPTAQPASFLKLTHSWHHFMDKGAETRGGCTYRRSIHLVGAIEMTGLHFLTSALVSSRKWPPWESEGLKPRKEGHQPSSPILSDPKRNFHSARRLSRPAGHGAGFQFGVIHYKYSVCDQCVPVWV